MFGLSIGGISRSAISINLIDSPTPSTIHDDVEYFSGDTFPINSTFNPFVNLTPFELV